jgi:hypothetical protein
LLQNASAQLGAFTRISTYFDGYLTEINFVDGQALTPSSFGETDAVTGVWKPKKYAGTYGTNGFYLNFSDNSNNTAATIGKDYSGNGNNWTPNNISVTSGVTYDSMLDVPTNWADGGNGRGNYAVLNPLFAAGTVSDGNLKHTASTTTWVNTSSTIFVNSGKWYFEATNIAGNYTMIGVATNSASTSQNYGTATNTWTYFNDGTKYGNGATATAYGASYTTGDVIGVALDMDAGTLTFYKNGVSQGTAFSTGLSGLTLCPWFGSYTNGNGVNVNFGQRPFSYTPPSGFKALNTFNLPTPTIVNGASYMAATTYTGNGAARSVANTVNGTSMQPDLVWIKSRNTTWYNVLEDSVRGVFNALYSNTTGAESSPGGVSAFNSNGFSLDTYNNTNNNTDTYVAWQWKAGGTSSSNTNGSITSTVSVNATAGFSVVTFTSPGGSAQTIGHGLGVAPSFIIMKSRNNSSGWNSYHASLGNTQQINLQSTAAATSSVDWWNNTSPTSSVWTIGANLNISTWTWVAYCFSAVHGYSAFGSYTGNGSSDGPFVFTGFRPRFVMIKNITNAADWYITDTARDPYNVTVNKRTANPSTAESSNSGLGQFDVLSNGFKQRQGAGTGLNNSGDTYIYAAFAENPFKLSLAR